MLIYIKHFGKQRARNDNCHHIHKIVYCTVLQLEKSKYELCIHYKDIYSISTCILQLINNAAGEFARSKARAFKTRCKIRISAYSVKGIALMSGNI